MSNVSNVLNFDAEDKSVEDIIFKGRERFRIPRYQRPYSWDQDQVSDLWNDLQDEDGCSFFGSFVFSYEKAKGEEGYVEVIDGQQRLLTLMILAASLRDKYKELGDEAKAKLTHDNIIAFQNPISGDYTYRVQCGESIDKFFNEYIQKYDTGIMGMRAPKEKEKRLVRNNYIFFCDQITDVLKTIENRSEKIKYLDGLKRRVADLKIIWIKIESEEDAYTIFEIVNARGAELTTADLLKNYLFQRIRTREAEVDVAKQSWSNIEDNVNSVGGRLTVSKFIRYFWISRYTFTPEKRLYKDIKNTITNPGMFLKELEEASGWYYDMMNGDVATWESLFEDNKKIGQKIYEALKGLKIMGITQCYSLLLCLLMNKDKSKYNFSEVFKFIEKYHFVYSAVCKQPGNVVERIYHKTAKSVHECLNSEVKNKEGKLQSIIDNFKNELSRPVKETFVEKFKEIDYKDRDLVVYVLSNFESYFSGTGEKDLNFSKINIEHILPQDPKKWGLEKKEVKEYVNLLGNLTLLSRKINGEIGNDPLKKKAKLLKDSELIINGQLLEKFKELKYNWGEKEIKERQEKMAEIAYDKIWIY